MSKFATKAAANMFCQARYEAAKSNERLSSREGAAEEIGIDRTRLARIELGSTIPYQEEVLLMADCYKAPELKGNYCSQMCPLGKNMPKIENAGLDRISLRMLSSFKKINEATQTYLSNYIKRHIAVIPYSKPQYNIQNVSGKELNCSYPDSTDKHLFPYEHIPSQEFIYRTAKQEAKSANQYHRQ